MTDARKPFRYELTRRGEIVVCTVVGHIDAPSAVTLFADVRRELTSRPGRQIIVYDAGAIDSFDSAVVPEAQRSARELTPHLRGFAVVSTKAFVRFALSMVKLATPHTIAVFEHLPQAIAWGERALRGP
jgi:hypothetical protein